MRGTGYADAYGISRAARALGMALAAMAFGGWAYAVDAPPSGIPPADVASGRRNAEIMRLAEDAETIRRALAAAWERAFDARAAALPLVLWTGTGEAAQQARRLARAGPALYETAAAVDHGIQSLKFARDADAAWAASGEAGAEIAFWRGELAAAAAAVAEYADFCASIERQLRQRFDPIAEARGLRLSPVARPAALAADGCAGIDWTRTDADGMAAVRRWRNLAGLEAGYLFRKYRDLGLSRAVFDEGLDALLAGTSRPAEVSWLATLRLAWQRRLETILPLRADDPPPGASSAALAARLRAEGLYDAVSGLWLASPSVSARTRSAWTDAFPDKTVWPHAPGGTFEAGPGSAAVWFTRPQEWLRLPGAEPARTWPDGQISWRGLLIGHGRLRDNRALDPTRAATVDWTGPDAPAVHVVHRRAPRWDDLDPGRLELAFPLGPWPARDGLPERPARTYGDPRGPGNEPEFTEENDPEAPELSWSWRRLPGDHPIHPARAWLWVDSAPGTAWTARALVQEHLASRRYRLRVGGGWVAAFDAARGLPLSAEAGGDGLRVEFSLSPGRTLALLFSRTPMVEGFARGELSGRSDEELWAVVKRMVDAPRAEPVYVFAPADIAAHFRARARKPGDAKPVSIHFGSEANRPAAERLARALREKFGLASDMATAAGTHPVPLSTFAADDAAGAEDAGQTFSADVVIGDLWSNDDFAALASTAAMGGMHWPLWATYRWPGPGRAAVALTRPWAYRPQAWAEKTEALVPVRDTMIERRRLIIAANGPDAVNAVERLAAVW